MTPDSSPHETAEPHPVGDGDGRPNVVLVVMDTARGVDTVPADADVTPTLASLADAGTEFTRAYTSAPWTLPAHASLFTGLYTAAHGAHGGHTYLDTDHETLPEAFQSAGYETVGISNNCWITGEFGFDRGFERFRKGWQYVQSDVDTGAVVRATGVSNRLTSVKKLLTTGNPVSTLANVVYERLREDDGAARTTDWVDGWLRSREGDRPFFLFCNYIEPHIPYDPPRAYAERFLSPAAVDAARQLRQAPRAFDVGEYELSDRDWELLRGLYRGEIAYVDAQLDRLRESLRAAGEWEQTVVVVVGDHGENIGEYGFFGHQYNLHENLLHVPLVIAGGPFRDGDQYEQYVQLLDLVPTLLETTGVSVSKLSMQCQGQSVHPSSTTPRTAVYAEHVQPRPTVAALETRFGDLPATVRQFDRSLRAIRTDQGTYIRGSDGSQWLYPAGEAGEHHDRTDRRPALAARLDTRLDDWLGSVERDQPTGSGAEVSAATEQRLAELGYL
ncbi:sulfatase [Halohasta salina]|uniref:sulfatase n=1 Tax=Halohasta salina TaxID=2961621 RepID=UPI0020A234A8|nr:sulfatase [Halohasta salina]